MVSFFTSTKSIVRPIAKSSSWATATVAAVALVGSLVPPSVSDGTRASSSAGTATDRAHSSSTLSSSYQTLTRPAVGFADALPLSSGGKVTKRPLPLNRKSPTLLASSAQNDDDLQAYHLMWSPGALPKLVLTSAALVGVPRLFQIPPPVVLGSGLIVKFWSNLGLPLMASACCLLQLGLNVVAVGCAGWNTVLGPIRPYFLSLLLVSTFQQPPKHPWVILGRFTVAFLPELLHTYDKFQSKPNEGRILASSASHVVEVTLDIPSMGCVACIHSVNGALRALPGVIQVQSQLNPFGRKGGSATIQLRPEIEQGKPRVEALKESSSASIDDDFSSGPYEHLVEAVDKVGFGGARVQVVRTVSGKRPSGSAEK